MPAGSHPAKTPLRNPVNADPEQPHTLEYTQAHLEQIARHDPEAEHVVIWDGAGFHHKQGDLRIPRNIHLVQLPAYSPELNPIERLWDIMKDKICNRIFETLDSVEEKISEALKPYREDSSYALGLAGDGWMHSQANVS
ncbi:transposase [Pontiellaceae bacterium B12219]|nr:transposase [Pontiellaceae bacterium B12219]